MAEKEEEKMKRGDSSIHQKAEKEILEIFSKKEGGIIFEKRKIKICGKSYFEIDGSSPQGDILCEVNSHIGKQNGSSSRPDKVMTDALRLIYARKLIGGNVKCILLFACEDAASQFTGEANTWHSHCLKEFNIDVKVVKIPDKLRTELLTEQKV